MNINMLTIVLLSSLLAGCVATPKVVPSDTPSDGKRIFRACESLRASDPTIARQGVQELFIVGGLEAYTILHLKWIAEPNPEIRKAILHGFSKIGDHRNIVDPGFPKEWVDAARRFSPAERRTRLQELREYFPEEMKRHR